MKTVIIITWVTLCVSVCGQITQTIKKADIIADPSDPKSVLGRLYPGTEIRKIGKDASGEFIKATLDFYLPLETLKEGRVAKKIGEWQTADNARVKLLQVSKQGNTVEVSVIIENRDKNDMDVSALLLFKMVDGQGNIGNLEFLESKNSVGIVKPSQRLRSDLVYRFMEPPDNVELSFQSKLGGDQVFFLLGF
ncbi:MAG: hypothetical protein V3U24_03210 [Candidatus Neomarinimicrobiota bacterium]